MDKNEYAKIINAKTILCEYCQADECNTCRVQSLADDVANEAINVSIKEMIVSTIKEYGWESAKNLALAFWTTYCCATDISPDTANYDNTLFEIWTELNEIDNFKLLFDDFDGIMCQNLV